MEEELVKMLLAVVLGGAIGFERELREKAAGIRTIVLITLASTLFTLTSIEIAGDSDPAGWPPRSSPAWASSAVA